MMYDIDGVVAVPHDTTGEKLGVAYDIDGNRIYPDIYASHTITDMFRAGGGNQGLDVYGNYIAQYFGGSYNIGIINLDTGSTAYTIPSGLTAHGNDISFSKDFYDDKDTLPILYVGGTGLRLDVENLTATVVKQLSTAKGGTEWAQYGNAFGENRYYAVGYTAGGYQHSADNKVYIDVWDTSNMADNGEGTYYPTLISRCQRDWLECIQGVAYHDGMIWLACGLGNNPAHVYALNPKDGSIVVDVEIEESGELEGIGWAHSEADGWYAVIGQRYNNGWYRKITFSAK